MKRSSEVRRRRLVAQFDSSGMSLAAFCRKHSVSPASLYSWRRRYVESSTLEPAVVSPPQWLPVELKAAETRLTPAAFVVEAAGMRLHLPSGFHEPEAAVLLRLVHALQAGGVGC